MIGGRDLLECCARMSAWGRDNGKWLRKFQSNFKVVLNTGSIF